MMGTANNSHMKYTCLVLVWCLAPTHLVGPGNETMWLCGCYIKCFLLVLFCNVYTKAIAQDIPLTTFDLKLAADACEYPKYNLLVHLSCIRADDVI